MSRPPAEAAFPDSGRQPVRLRRRFGTWLLIGFGLFAADLCGYEFAVWRGEAALDRRTDATAALWGTVAGWLGPGRADGLLLRARVARRQGDLDLALALLERSVAAGAAAERVARERLLLAAQSGHSELLRGRWNSLFETAGGDGPEISRAFVTEALARFQVREAAAVIAAWQQDFPEDPMPWVFSGRIARVTQRWSDAEAAYGEALRRDPALLEARGELAEALVQLVRFEDAARELEQVVAAAAPPVRAWALLGECLAKTGQVDLARRRLQAALQQHPKSVEILWQLGRLEVEAGRREAGIDALQQAAGLQPENAELRYALGKALVSVGRQADAQPHLEYMEQAAGPLQQINELTRRIEQGERTAELRYEVGRLTWTWRSRADGAAWLENALLLDPAHRDAHALLAEHYRLLHDEQRAEQHRTAAGTEP